MSEQGLSCPGFTSKYIAGKAIPTPNFCYLGKLNRRASVNPENKTRNRKLFWRQNRLLSLQLIKVILKSIFITGTS